MAPLQYSTREAWLQAAIAKLAPEYPQDLPEVRVSVGFPKGVRGGKHAIGQCWYTAEDGIAAVFISPELGPVDVHKGQGVLPTLVHELVHVLAGPEAGHKGAFRTIAQGIGLEGKMTSTHAGESLAQRLHALAEELGPYPHGKLSGSVGKKQSTRMLKAECAPCEYIVRLSRKAAEYGMPTCPCGEEMRLAE